MLARINNDDNSGTIVIGRPRRNVSKENIIFLFELIHNWKIVATMFGISDRTLRRRRQEYGLPVSNRFGPRETYTNLTSQELNAVVQQILELSPDAGETMVLGGLRARGIIVQRRRIRDAIMAVDPEERISRRRTTVRRRQYNINHPNELWYLYIAFYCDFFS